ncbi:MAG: HD domain-containing protein [Acidobacteriota bacterium]
MGNKIIRDAVHGDIVFTDEELKLIDTPQVQRMRGIKQLGASSLVYPSAVHTRFEHSLGTCWVAKRIIAAIRNNSIAAGLPPPIDTHAERVIAAAALLHDVTHIPYGHTFEDERRIFERHDENRARLAYFLDSKPIKSALKLQGIYSDVARVLTARREELAAPFIYQIVAGTVCADLLDYLRRDAYFCGLSHFYDERIFRYFTISNGHFVIELQKDGLFRHDALSELINLLRIRYTLTERVYYHHAKAVAGAMISKALELALGQGRIKLEDLFELRDDSFLYFLRTRAHNRAVTGLIDAIEQRQLYKRVYFLTLQRDEARGGINSEQQRTLEQLYHYNEEGARTRVERELAERLRLPEGAVIIYCPSAAMALKEAAVPVKVDERGPRSLRDFNNPEINNLTDKHRHLWRFFVCVNRAYKEKFERIGELCEDFFGHRNMLKLQAGGQLSFDFSPIT